MANTMLLYAHLTDRELMEKIKAGQTACFEVLVRKHSRAIYRIGRMYGFAHGNVEDLMADLQISAFGQIVGDRIRAPYRVWLIEAMMQKCVHSIHNVNKILLDAEDCREPAATPVRNLYHYDTERLQIDKELTSRLEDNIDRLPVSLRTVFVLTEIEGCNTLEAARLLKIPELSVKEKMVKAKTLISKNVNNWYYHSDIYSFPANCCERLVNRVMRVVDKEKYSGAYAAAPEN